MQWKQLIQKVGAKKKRCVKSGNERKKIRKDINR